MSNYNKNIIKISNNYKLSKVYNQNEKIFNLFYVFNEITIYKVFIHFFKNLNIKIKNEDTKFQISIDYSNYYINNFKFNFNIIININKFLLNFYKKNSNFLELNIEDIKIFFFYHLIYKIEINNKNNNNLKYINMKELNEQLFKIIYFLFNKELYDNNKNNEIFSENKLLNDLLKKLYNKEIKNFEEDYINHEFFKKYNQNDINNYEELKLYTKKFFLDNNLNKLFELYKTTKNEKIFEFKNEFKNYNIIYKGEVKSEQEKFIAEGRGLIEFNINENPNYYYLGNFSNGKIEGKGTIIIIEKKITNSNSNDSFYILEGEFKNNELKAGTLYNCNNIKTEDLEEIKNKTKIKSFFSTIESDIFFCDKTNNNISNKKYFDIDNFKYIKVIFSNESFLGNLINIFSDFFFEKEFVDIDWNNDNREYFIDLNDFNEKYFEKPENYKNAIQQEYWPYFNDIILLIIITIYSLLISASSEYNFNLYCYEDFQKIKLKHLQQKLISTVINLKNVNFDLCQFLLKIDGETNNLNIFVNIIRNLYKGMIKNFKIKNEKNDEYKELPKMMNIFKEEEKKNDNEILSNLFILSWCYYCFKENPLFNGEYKNENLFGVFNISCAHLTQFNSAMLLFVLRLFGNKTKSLQLQYNELGQIGSYCLGTLFLFSKNIETLMYNKNNLETNHLFYFIKGLNSIENFEFFNLKKIDFTGNLLNEKSGKEIAKLIKLSPKLEELNLNKNEKIGDGIIFIINAILIMMNKMHKKNQKYNLKILLLSMISLQPKGINELSKLIKSKKCTIEILSLNYNNLNNFAGYNLIKNIKYNKNLKEIYLYNCEIKNYFVNNIKNIIRLCEINTLSLYQNNINLYENIFKLYFLFKIINIEKKNSCFPVTTNFDISYNNNFFIDSEYYNKTTKLIEEFEIENSDLENSKKFLIMIDRFELFKLERNKKNKEKN